MAAKKVIAIDVFEGKKYIRTYSKEVHGENFAKLAKEFTGKVPARKMKEVKASEEPKK